MVTDVCVVVVVLFVIITVAFYGGIFCPGPLPALWKKCEQMNVLRPQVVQLVDALLDNLCLLYTSPSPRDRG